MSFPASLPASALTGKAAAGLAVAFLAVGGAGATVAATASAKHSSNATVSAPAAPTHNESSPTNNQSSDAFGQQVKAQVATCKSQLTAGQHGIGQCVSAWVVAHNPGASQRDASSHATSHPTGGAPTSHPGH